MFWDVGFFKEFIIFFSVDMFLFLWIIEMYVLMFVLFLKIVVIVIVGVLFSFKNYNVIKYLIFYFVEIVLMNIGI